MTALLEQAVAALSQLPPDRQDELAREILAEIADEEHWDRQFAGTLERLERLADEALEERRSGLTRPLEELL